MEFTDQSTIELGTLNFASGLGWDVLVLSQSGSATQRQFLLDGGSVKGVLFSVDSTDDYKLLATSASQLGYLVWMTSEMFSNSGGINGFYSPISISLLPTRSATPHFSASVLAWTSRLAVMQLRPTGIFT